MYAIAQQMISMDGYGKKKKKKSTTTVGLRARSSFLSAKMIR